jgi:hypothetical protein
MSHGEDIVTLILLIVPIIVSSNLPFGAPVSFVPVEVARL